MSAIDWIVTGLIFVASWWVAYRLAVQHRLKREERGRLVKLARMLGLKVQEGESNVELRQRMKEAMSLPLRPRGDAVGASGASKSKGIN